MITKCQVELRRPHSWRGGEARQILFRLPCDEDRDLWDRRNVPKGKTAILAALTEAVDGEPIDRRAPGAAKDLREFYRTMPTVCREQCLMEITSAADPAGVHALDVTCPFCDTRQDVPAVGPIVPEMLRDPADELILDLSTPLVAGQNTAEQLRIRLETGADQEECWPMRHQGPAGDNKAERAMRARRIVEPEWLRNNTATVGKMALPDLRNWEKWDEQNVIVPPGAMAKCIGCGRIIVYGRAVSPFFS